MVPKSWVDAAIVADRVTAIVVSRPNSEQRHQVKIGQTKVFEIADMLAELAEVFAEKVDVQRASYNLFRLKPVGFVDPMPI